MKNKFKVELITIIDNEKNDNVDVYVTLPNGFKYVVTFFTLLNIKHLMNKWKETKELSGQYFWAHNMCIIEDLNKETIISCINEMIENENFEQIFMKVKS